MEKTIKTCRWLVDGSPVSVVSIVGELDLAFSYQLQKVLETVIGELEGGSALYIDLSGVEYIASTGVGSLSTALILARTRKVNLYLVNMKPRLRTVFTVLGLIGWFEEKTVENAHEL